MAEFVTSLRRSASSSQTAATFPSRGRSAPRCRSDRASAPDEDQECGAGVRPYCGLPVEGLKPGQQTDAERTNQYESSEIDDGGARECRFCRGSRHCRKRGKLEVGFGAEGGLGGRRKREVRSR